MKRKCFLKNIKKYKVLNIRFLFINDCKNISYFRHSEFLNLPVLHNLQTTVSSPSVSALVEELLLQCLTCCVCTRAIHFALACFDFNCSIVWPHWSHASYVEKFLLLSVSLSDRLCHAARSKSNQKRFSFSFLCQLRWSLTYLVLLCGIINL